MLLNNFLKKIHLLLSLFFINYNSNAQKVFPGADEKTPSRSQYFSWINNTNEGATEKQTLINLEFFKWLKEEYGMNLNIYAFDAGNIDGKQFYGSIYSERFKKQFPNGFGSIYKKAKSINTRLGVWGGPDGFGNTPDEEKNRIDQMVKLCKEYEFELFKFDGVCGNLRPEKEDSFIKMMIECRKYSPDLILLNHRLPLTKGLAYATTFLWDGQETYIDVHASNHITAPHHRAGAISRGLVPGLQRLAEDHGVCISSSNDYWDDDLILQAFSRSLILAPEIYGNPWLLRDDEFPKLARIYNLHKRYNEILVNGIILPDKYGPFAVARGDKNQRLITLRNLSWKDTIITIRLNEEIGLAMNAQIEVRQYHPTEKILGFYKYGDTVKVIVPSFHSMLLYAGKIIHDEPAVTGVNFNVIQDVKGKPVKLELLGLPGTDAKIKLNNASEYLSANLDNVPIKNLTKGESITVKFSGKQLKLPYHRKIADLELITIPVDAGPLYEATVFSADNNALEVRSLQRSGWSMIPDVRKAQEAFFNQNAFVDRGVWDKNLFDGNLKTGFWPSQKFNINQTVKNGCLRLDLGEISEIDEIRIKVPDYFSLQPILKDEGNYVNISNDLIHWKTINFIYDTNTIIKINTPFRYLKLDEFPHQIVEIEGYKNGKLLSRNQWKASNLFAPTYKMEVKKVWKTTFKLSEIPKGSYLCLAINGEHGTEEAYAGAKIDGKLIGFPDRALAYPSNAWEYYSSNRSGNYTYYLPLSEDMVNKPFEVYTLAYNADKLNIKPELFISSNPAPYEKITLILERK